MVIPVTSEAMSTPMMEFNGICGGADADTADTADATDATTATAADDATVPHTLTRSGL